MNAKRCNWVQSTRVFDPPAWRIAPSLKRFLGVHSHTAHMKGHVARVLQEAMASVECCFIFLLIPLCLGFLSRECKSVCVLLVLQCHTLPESGYWMHTPVGSVSLVNRLRQEVLKDNILLLQHVCHSSPKGNFKKKHHISTSKSTQRRMLLLRGCSFIELSEI